MAPVPQTQWQNLHLEEIDQNPLDQKHEDTVYQRCLLLKGHFTKSMEVTREKNDSITISVADNSGQPSFPAQTWPVTNDQFKALVFLSPGRNIVSISHDRQADRNDPQAVQRVVHYVPLLQTPPLHLAILVAKDSPLLIDCPPGKQGGISSAHASLDAAVAKLRMTAYMWQAFTADDMHSKGLGRRSFRLEEEWMADTVSQEFCNAANEDALWNGAMRGSARVHIVPSEKTVAELRDANVAQQNPNGRRRDDLHKYFNAALQKYGGPFTASARPVVAGLILDSHYSLQQDLILGHAAIGCHQPEAISLGVLGSHLTYSWPRFVEEVTSCFLDTKNPGPTVGNDNGECGTMWEACAIGQGAFMHEVGHAFGAGHTSGIMARGYAQHWARNFLARTAYCSATKEGPVNIATNSNIAEKTNSITVNNATWDIQDALSFKTLPHFWLPYDGPRPSSQEIGAVPTISVLDEDEDFPRILIKGTLGGIARIRLNNATRFEISMNPNIPDPDQNTRPIAERIYTLAELEDATSPPRAPLSLEVLGMNGKVKSIPNVWRLLANRNYVKIPGTKLRLLKRSVASGDEQEGHGMWEWAVMLKKRGADGQMVNAKNIDLRVGCIFDGAVMRYEDGRKVNLGVKDQRSYGGHASEMARLKGGAEVVKVEIATRGWSCLKGVRMHLSDGRAKGELNAQQGDEGVVSLEPAAGEKIVGFCGKSELGSGFCCEFGIITAPKDVELPVSMYEMAELQNTDGGLAAGEGDGDGGDDMVSAPPGFFAPPGFSAPPGFASPSGFGMGGTLTPFAGRGRGWIRGRGRGF